MADFLTSVNLYKGVPLDVTNSNQLKFSSLSAQESYFYGKAPRLFDGAFYQRKDRYVALSVNCDEIQDYSYLSFINPQYGLNKVFYAFITQIEYRGANSSFVYFKIDSWQTYQFDIALKECYVEREHVSNDTIGLNLEEEGLAIGDYVTQSSLNITFNLFWIIVATTIDLRELNSFPEISGDLYGGIYSGVAYFCFDADEDEIWVLESVLKSVDNSGKSDAIISMFMIPKMVVSNTQRPYSLLKTDLRDPEWYRVPETQTFGGYSPRNNKLLTYPYRALVMSNNEGNSATLRYEFFDSSKRIEYQGGMQLNSKVIMYPKNYKGVDRNFDESIAIGNFPQCCWSKDLYANWFASQSVRWGYQTERFFTGAQVGVATSTISTVASTANVIEGGLVGGVANFANNIINTENAHYNMISNMAEEKEIYSMVPNSVGGTIGNGYTNISIKAYGFFLQERTITREKAIIIDKYFDMKGYAVKRVKIPNITGRRSWNFVKTINCNLIGNIPNWAISEIKGLFDSGITFWHGDYVGDYSRDNTIGGTVTPSQFRLDVINGTGGGSYNPGTYINIAANDPDNEFFQWESSAGEFTDKYITPTNFLMPSQNVSVSWLKSTQVANTIADLMMADLGAVEWDSTVGKIQRWYYGSYVKAAWCTTAISYYANEMGLIPTSWIKHENVDSSWNSVYAMHPELCWRTSNYGGTDTMPKRGDIIYFSSQYTTADLTHVGCVTSVNGTSISYVSGNTSNPSGGADGIFEKTLDITNRYVVCFYALPY